MNKNKEIAKKVVDRIVATIEEGKPLPWVKPWGRSSHTVTVQDGVKTVVLQPSAWNRRGKQYRGANTYLPVGEYITYKQAHDESFVPRKGSKGWPVVYWHFMKKTTTDPDTGEEKTETIPFLKYYTVFRVEDCINVWFERLANGREIAHAILDDDGNEIPMTAKYSPKPTIVEYPVCHTEHRENGGDLDDTAEDVIADYVSRAGNGFYVKRDRDSDRAYYSPMGDYVVVPRREQFAKQSEYYSTMFHELGHSTGHKTRLNRFRADGSSAAFGSEEYSREELVAEATAASVLNAIGMEEANTFRNSAAYIKSWASHLQADPMMYVTAMTRAQAAFDLIVGVTEDETEEDGE